MTLAFLGPTPTVRLREVEAAAEAAAARTAPFSFRIDRLGRFPAEGLPRTLWAGPASRTTELELVASHVRAQLDARGLGFDAKPFRPHVTIARVQEGQATFEARAVAAAVASAAFDGPVVAVREISVIESLLSPRGARYLRRAGAPLRALELRRR